MSVTPRIAIEVDHVSHSYGGETVLDSVSFAIPEGRYVGIVGPNGGGKTTMLKIMLGILKPSQGTVSIFGQTPAQARLSGKIGYIPQRIAQADFSFPATVEEIVRSGRTSKVGIGRWMTKKDTDTVERSMETAGVISFRNRLISSLSGGERQKVFIARALASDPDVLILDEPTTGVDIGARKQFYALLKNLNTELGLTILHVSHDVDVMTGEASFVLALNQKLLCHCSAHDFLSDETLKRLYGRDEEILHHHTH